MSEQEYPHGRDCAWLASDAEGRVGVFITAGEAPILPAALAANVLPVLKIEAAVLQLRAKPAVCVQLRISVPRPHSFIELCRRGVFVYDWTDIHRAGEALDAYELVAVPAFPIHCRDLPATIRHTAQTVRLAESRFGESATVAVQGPTG